MTAWSADELSRVGEAEELRLASHRSDGTLRPWVTMWVVQVGDDIYVRSAHGPDNGWYRRAKASGTGRIRAGGVEREVRFEDGSAAPHGDLDAEYHRKYDKYGPRIVGTVVGDKVAPLTLRLVPTED